MNADTDFEPFTLELTRTATVLFFKLDAATVEEYFRALARFPLARVVSGLEQARTACKFMPRPVEVMELMGVGVEREPSFTERMVLPSPERRALTSGEPAKLTVDMVKASVAALRKRLEEPKRVRDPAQEREEVAFWERVDAIKNGEHL